MKQYNCNACDKKDPCIFIVSESHKTRKPYGCPIDEELSPANWKKVLNLPRILPAIPKNKSILLES